MPPPPTSRLPARLCVSVSLWLHFLLLTAAAPKAPPGFSIEKVSPPETSFPMFACLDDRGRLFVAESSGLDLYLELQKQTRKCRIRMLEDRDNDGRYETSTVFKDQLVFPMGVAWRDGKLYVPDPPDVLVLEDTNNDGKSDKETKILTGFGHQDNGSLHGLTFGPDGMLYMTTGNPDGYKLKRADGSILSGESGALFRCNPDGSNIEVLCRGFENLVEVVFMPGGQIIGTDNWFQRPAGGLRDALVHLVPGAHYPLHQRDKGTQFLVSGEPLPAVSMFPAVALSGLMRYEGDSFPAEYKNNLFSAQHNSRAVGRHILSSDRSTFTSQDSAFITSDDPDFHPSDVLEDADGSLLIVDTGGWYVQHCPTGQIRNSRAPGGIYRVHYSLAKPIDDPRGLNIDWDKASTEQLVALLADTRTAVVHGAQRTLVSRRAEAIPHLAAALNRQEPWPGTAPAAWTLAKMSTEAALVPLRDRLRNPRNSRDLALMARIVASRRDQKSAEALELWVTGRNAEARIACAEALAVCGRRESIPSLIGALIDPDVPPDRFLEHAITNAIYTLGTPNDFRAALAHEDPRVKKIGLILLDQKANPALKPQELVACLRSGDRQLRWTAQRLLKSHPEWSQQALDEIRRDWNEKHISDEKSHGIIETVIAFSGDAETIRWLGDALASTSEYPRKRLVLSAMARLPPPAPGTFENWIEPLRRCLADRQLRQEAVRVVSALPTSEFNAELRKILAQRYMPSSLRLDALRSLMASDPKLDDTSFDLLLEHLSTKKSASHRLTAAELIARAQLTETQLKSVLEQIQDDRLISPETMFPLLARSASKETEAPVIDYLKKSIVAGWRPPPDRLQPLRERLGAGIDDLMKKLREHAANQANRLSDLEPLLNNGNPARGREIFFGNQVACSTCHRIGTDGGLVGPDLTKVGAIRAGRDLLESIVFPASTIAQGYDHYIIDLKNGDQLTGIIAERTDATITLRDSASQTRIIRMSDVKNMRRDTTSLMPQGLDTALRPDQFRDLLAYLQSLK